MSTKEGRPSSHEVGARQSARTTTDSTFSREITTNPADVGSFEPDSWREIRLTNGTVTIVDAADFEWLASYRWTEHRSGYPPKSYAIAHIGERSVGMARLILDMEPCNGLVAHHVNGDGLDNRRCNLIAVTHGEHRLIHAEISRHVKAVTS